MPKKGFYTVPGAAKYLGRSLWGLQTLVEVGTITTLTVRGKETIARQDLDALLQAQKDKTYVLDPFIL